MGRTNRSKYEKLDKLCKDYFVWKKEQLEKRELESILAEGYSELMNHLHDPAKFAHAYAQAKKGVR